MSAQVPTLSKNFMAKSEGSLISCLVLLLYIIPYMSDALLMDVLQVSFLAVSWLTAYVID